MEELDEIDKMMEKIHHDLRVCTWMMAGNLVLTYVIFLLVMMR